MLCHASLLAKMIGQGLYVDASSLKAFLLLLHQRVHRESISWLSAKLDEV